MLKMELSVTRTQEGSLRKEEHINERNYAIYEVKNKRNEEKGNI